jgi:hypothetical protein
VSQIWSRLKHFSFLNIDQPGDYIITPGMEFPPSQVFKSANHIIDTLLQQKSFIEKPIAVQNAIPAVF